MKRKISTLLLALVMMLSCIQLPAAATTSAPADSEPIEAAFTDAAFLTAVRETIGKTNGEHIYAQDVEGITKLDVSDLGISNLDGIEYFTGLTELICYANTGDFVKLDLSNNPNLEVLDCSYNEYLASLNVSNCPELTFLDCNNTALERLDLRKNTKLISLFCYETQLRTLNVSNNPLLEEMEVWGSHLVNLDVSNSSSLSYLDCSYNDMLSVESVMGRGTTLQGDAFVFEPQNTEPVTEFFTDDKFLDAVRESIEKPSGDIYPEDLTAITDLAVNNSGITSLNGIEYMTGLETLDCTSNYLKELDLYSNKSLVSVQCGDNDLTELDLSGNKMLTTLYAHDNELTALDVSKSPDLSTLNVSDNELLKMDLSSNAKLVSLNCSENAILSLDDLNLPESINSQLTPDVETSFEPVELYGLTIEFLPQIPVFFEVEGYTTHDGTMVISGRGSKNTKVQIYDVTDFDSTKIPERYWEESALLEVKNQTHSGIINQLTENGIYLGEVPSFKQDYYGELSLGTNIRTEEDYKILAVHHNRQKADSARIITVPNSVTRVTSLTFNNNRGSGVVDVYNTFNPILKTYGLSGYKSTFIVGIENAEMIDRAYINVSRNNYGNRHDDRNKDVELFKMDDGTFQAKLKLSGGEVSTGGLGDIQIKCIFNGSTEKTTIYTKPVKLILDPSGYIYEGVPSNRLSDVKTTLFYKDRDGATVEWDAAEYNQLNPIFTDKNGRFEWFVPFGLWQVKAEREGYEPFYTDWMRVPPTQMDVNFGMISNEKPAIAQLCAYPDVIEINFNKYVYAEDITTGNVVVYADGQQVQGTVRLVNSEVDSWVGEFNQEASGGTGNRYVSQIRFFPNFELPLDTSVQISLNENIRSYAGVTVGSGYSQEAMVNVRPTSLTLGGGDVELAGGGHIVYYGETSIMEMSLLPIEASKGKKLLLTNNNPDAISVPTEVIVDENGIAKIPMTGLVLGEAQITMLLEGSNLSSTVDIEINVR